jgi:hypothetical protein
MLADFSEIDNHLVSNVEALYEAVQDIHDIDDHFLSLTDTQRNAIKKFWGDFYAAIDKNDNQLHHRFIRTWELLYPLYQGLRDSLLSDQLAYEGLLHRQVILLSADEGEARMLGANVFHLRLVILLIATLMVSSVVSLTGLISFVGLLAPHGARLLTKSSRSSTVFLSGLIGGILLCGADIFARSAGSAELPVSIFTSLLGVPFLVLLIVRGRREL